jgi:hypothetical protein
MRYDEIDLETDQIPCEFPKAFVSPLGPSVFNEDALAFDRATAAQKMT